MNTDLYELNEAELEQVAGGKTWGDMFNDIRGKWEGLQLSSALAQALRDLRNGSTGGTGGSGGAGPAGGGAGPAPA